MKEQWRELKETITEMRDNDGTGTQQEVCKFLVNLMDVLEKQMSELPSVTPTRPKGKWKRISPAGIYECTNCNQVIMTSDIDCYKFCHGCGVRMEGEE